MRQPCRYTSHTVGMLSLPLSLVADETMVRCCLGSLYLHLNGRCEEHYHNAFFVCRPTTLSHTPTTSIDTCNFIWQGWQRILHCHSLSANELHNYTVIFWENRFTSFLFLIEKGISHVCCILAIN